MLFLCYIYELVSYLCFPDILETEYMRSHLLIGAASSGSGKTTFTLGLLRALRNRSDRDLPNINACTPPIRSCSDIAGYPFDLLSP